MAKENGQTSHLSRVPLNESILLIPAIAPVLCLAISDVFIETPYILWNHICHICKICNGQTFWIITFFLVKMSLKCISKKLVLNTSKFTSVRNYLAQKCFSIYKFLTVFELWWMTVCSTCLVCYTTIYI